MLETKSKFNITSPNKNRPFTCEQFFQWSNRNMYRTSYNDMKSRCPSENKNQAIPKYSGYVPGKNANNEIGGTFNTITKRCFSRDKLEGTPNLFASTGFNWTKLPKNDETLSAWSYKYGAQTMQKPHPAINDNKWSTITRENFQKPTLLPKQTMRHSASCQTLAFDSKLKDATRPSTKASGFMKNSMKADGQGWLPKKELHSDQVRTEYRIRFNREKPFHLKSIMLNTGRLPRKTLVYDKE